MARQRHSDDEQRLDAATVREFEILRGQIQTFYDEVSILSKKNPDGKLNKFKLGFINGTLKKATAMLGESHRPFAEFETFAEDELPSTSDVGMMLSQYLDSMARYKRDHTCRKPHEIGLYWRTEAGVEIRAD
jgi:hypothetical protein